MKYFAYIELARRCRPPCLHTSQPPGSDQCHQSEDRCSRRYLPVPGFVDSGLRACLQRLHCHVLRLACRRNHARIWDESLQGRPISDSSPVAVSRPSTGSTGKASEGDHCTGLTIVSVVSRPLTIPINTAVLYTPRGPADCVSPKLCLQPRPLGYQHGTIS